MSDHLPSEARRVLERAAFCHVVTATPSGPHVTPMVFALAGDRLWVTTSRGSVKAQGWSRDPRVSGVVRHGPAALAFVGTATTYDVLDAESWGRSVRAAPLLALAAARFTRKNARFFAGYAVDAHRVPLAWTPPGRVFAELRIERTALVEDGLLARTWGDWGSTVLSHDRFRASRTGRGPLDVLPDEVRRELGGSGHGAVALEGELGVVALPSAWASVGPSLYAVLPASTLALAGAGSPSPSVALGADRSSWWRARHMVGAMARGHGDVFVADRLVSGGRSAAAVAREAGASPEGAALVRLRPESVVWWRGWSSGTVAVA